MDENTVLIGHSCGCAFLVRWLGETKRKIKKLVLVAPWKIPDNDDPHRVDFYTYQIDPELRDRNKDIVIFTSDDEEQDGKKSALIFFEALGGKMRTLLKHGHYTMGDMGTQEFPELLDELIGEKGIDDFTGVIIEESLEKKDVLKNANILQTKVEIVTTEHKTPWIKQWTLHTIVIPRNKAESVANELSNSLDSQHS